VLADSAADSAAAGGIACTRRGGGTSRPTPRPTASEWKLRGTCAVEKCQWFCLLCWGGGDKDASRAQSCRPQNACMRVCACVRACIRVSPAPCPGCPRTPNVPGRLSLGRRARKRVGFGMIPNAGNTKQKQQLLWVGGCWGLTLSEIRQNSPLLLTLRTGRTHSGAAGGPRRETAPAARGPPLLLFEVGGYKKTKCR